MAWRPGVGSVTRPWGCTASPAAKRSARTMKWASNAASGRSLPFSRHSVSTTSSIRAVYASARWLRAVARSIGSSRHGVPAKQRAAASMASRPFSAPPSA
jgi:hypothetical protein